jgi:methanethiol S-methyltransferase
MRISLLGLLWVVWCCLHSLPIMPSVFTLLRRKAGAFFRYFRIVYNLTALLSLAPLLYLTMSWRGNPVFAWQSGWNILRFLLLGTSFLLFRAGARRYDIGYFLGLRQLQGEAAHTLLTDAADFVQDGIFGVTRHPWYLGSLFLLWSALPVYHDSTTMAAAVLSLYLIIGTLLEERRIVREFGDRYRAYQQDVSMLIPWKWLVKLVRKWFCRNE